MNLNPKLIQFAIAWGPTLLFLLGFVLAIFVGFMIGFRKSVIRLIHALITASICIILFFILVKNEKFDAFLLATTNKILKTDLQTILGVSEECKTFREVFHEYLPKSLDFMSGIALIIKDNGAYLDTLVDMAYRIIFGLVLYVLYLVILLLEEIFHLIFTSDLIYRRRRNTMYSLGMVDTPFHKRRVLGALVHGGRKLVEGVVALSFLGTLFFILGGGLGNKKIESYSFSVSNANLVYGSYEAIGEYGTTGIYKVLNAVHDKNDVPYYLFAADLIFQGGLKDEESNTNESIYFREELAAYVNFSRQTFDLVLKYASKDLDAYLKKEYDGDVMTLIMNLFMDENFQQEFRTVITDFDSKTYFTSLALSLLDSFMSHIDEFQGTFGLPDETKDILCILFQKGYYSSYIPYEKELALSNSTVELGYIQASHLLSKEDIFVAYDLFIDYIVAVNSGMEQMDMILSMIDSMIPDIKRLSILDTSRADELNPVLKRLYAFVDNVYLKNELTVLTSSTGLTEPYKDAKYDSINWVKELKLLVDCVADGYDVFRNIYSLDKTVLDMIFEIYDPEALNYSENSTKFNNVIQTLSDSALLGEVIRSTSVGSLIVNSLATLTENPYIPSDISYSNVYDSDGRLVEYGEIYNLFCGLRAFAANQENKELIEAISTGTFETTEDTISLVKSILGALDSRDPYTKNSIAYYITESDFLRATLTSFAVANSDLGGVVLYFDDQTLAKDSNGDTVKMFNKKDFRDFLLYSETLLDYAVTLMDGASDEQIMELLGDEGLYEMLDSKIIEGTISNILVQNLSGTEFVILPSSLMEHKGMVTTETEESEIRKLLGLTQKGIDIKVFTESYETDDDMANAIMDFIKGLSDQDRENILSSKILWYSISNYLTQNSDGSLGISLLIPEDSMASLTNDTISMVIKKDVLGDLLGSISQFLPEDGEDLDFETLLNNLIKDSSPLENKIIMATLVNTLVNDSSVKDQIGDALVIPESYKAQATPEILKKKFNKTNIWNREMFYLIDSLDCIFEVTQKGGKVVFDDSITDNILDNVKTFNTSYKDGMTKLEVIYQSAILVATFSKALDENLTSADISATAIEASKVKGTNSYAFQDLQALVDACVLYDLSLKDSDFDAVQDNIIDSIPTMNDKKPSNRDGLSDLDLIYESAIIREVFTKGIDELNIVTTSMQKHLKDTTNVYPKNEIANLIDFVNVMEITDFKDTDSIRDHIEEGILKLLDAPKDSTIEEESNISYLYTGSMTPCVLTKSLEENLTVPTDAYQKNGKSYYPFISLEEAQALLAAMRDLDIKVESFSFEKINFEKVDIDVFAGSTIISANFYKEIKDSEDLVIPNHVLNEGYSEKNIYLAEEEFKEFLTLIKSHRSTFFTEVEKDVYNVSSVSFNTDDITAPFLKEMISSKVLEATCIYKLMNDADFEISAPSSYKSDATKINLVENKNNTWYKFNEMSALANALEILLGDSKVKDIDKDKVESFVTDNTINQKNTKYGKTNLEVMYQSAVYAATMSSHIIDSFDSSTIDEDNYKNTLYYNYSKECYTESEISALANAFQEIKKKSGNPNFKLDDEISSSVLLKCDTDKLYASYIIRAFMTKGIKGASGSVLVHTDLAYEKLTKIYTEAELSSVLDLLKGVTGGAENVDYDDIKFDDSMTLKTLLGYLHVTDSGCTTNLLVQSISKNLCDNSQIVIPISEYDIQNGRIKPASVVGFLTSLNGFATTDAGLSMDFDFNTITVPEDEAKMDTITKSVMLRATIAKNLSVSAGGSIETKYIEYDAKYYSTEYDYKNSQHVVILTSDEIKAEFKAIHILMDGGSMQGEFDLAKLVSIYNDDSSKFMSILDSSVFYVTISELLSTKTINGTDAAAWFNIQKSPVTVYRIHSNGQLNLTLLSREGIQSFMNAYSSII